MGSVTWRASDGVQFVCNRIAIGGGFPRSIVCGQQTAYPVIGEILFVNRRYTCIETRSGRPLQDHVAGGIIAECVTGDTSSLGRRVLARYSQSALCVGKRGDR